MKFHLRRVLVIGIALISVLIIFWLLVALKSVDNEGKHEFDQAKYRHESFINSLTKRPLGFLSDEDAVDEEVNGNRRSIASYGEYSKIDCIINDEDIVRDCLKSSSKDVYIPFRFIQKYFEIGGSLIRKSNGKEAFNWQHSYSKVSLFCKSCLQN